MEGDWWSRLLTQGSVTCLFALTNFQTRSHLREGFLLAHSFMVGTVAGGLALVVRAICILYDISRMHRIAGSGLAINFKTC